ncbi:MAG: hypothetical protein KC912_21175, partial [Proteobacteria bacterium]|nr:hypothetical protein [Pseudomonadota bacterium]
RYRPVPVFGIELTGTHYDQSFGAKSDRRHTVISQSVGAFAFPERTVQPYALVGASELFRFVREEGASGMTRDIAAGPHAGVGVEIALGPRFGIDLEGRYTHFLGERTGTEPRGIVSTNLGFVIHL